MPGDSRATHHHVLEDSAAEEDGKGINTERMIKISDFNYISRQL